jgi:hypothetical protein
LRASNRWSSGSKPNDGLGSLTESDLDRCAVTDQIGLQVDELFEWRLDQVEVDIGVDGGINAGRIGTDR